MSSQRREITEGQNNERKLVYEKAKLTSQIPLFQRAEVRAQVDIVTPGVPSEGLRRSLEVFNNDTGATSVLMGGAAP